MSDCALGTLYSKAVVPSESRKTILLGRPILNKRMQMDHIRENKCNDIIHSQSKAKRVSSGSGTLCLFYLW